MCTRSGNQKPVAGVRCRPVLVGAVEHARRRRLEYEPANVDSRAGNPRCGIYPVRQARPSAASTETPRQRMQLLQSHGPVLRSARQQAEDRCSQLDVQDPSRLPVSS